MEGLDLPEWLKISLGLCGGAFAWGLVFVLSKSWINDHVIKPIQDLKTDNEIVEKRLEKFMGQINTFTFKILTSHQDHMRSTSKEISALGEMFSHASSHSTKAKLDAQIALEKVNILERNAEKFMKIATLVHNTNEALKTEIEQITEDLIFVKTKIKEPKE